MQISNAPVQIQLPFGNGDSTKTNPIPVPSQQGITPGAVSFTDGFPPLCAVPVNSGGVPPRKVDMNGILYMATAIDQFISAGGSFKYNSGFSAAIGGYPIGARLLNAAGTGFWISTADNNTTDPDTGGAGWIPDRAIASVYASTQQTLASGTSKVLWDTVGFDSFGMWQSGAKNFKALWPGKYRFSGSIYFPSPSGQLIATQIFQNGSLARHCNEYPQTSDGDMAYSFDAILNCSAGDTLDARVIVGASTLAGQSGSNQAFVYGQIEFLGA